MRKKTCVKSGFFGCYSIPRCSHLGNKITFRCRLDRLASLASREQSRDLKRGRRAEIVFVEAKRLSRRRCAIKKRNERNETGKHGSPPPARIVRYAYRLLNDPIECVTSVV